MTPAASEAKGRFARLARPLRTRAALGLRPLTAPVMLVLPIGALLGPQGSALITPAALSYLDVVISVALATLGVFVGIAAGTQRGPLRRVLTASFTEAAVTTIAVAVAVYLLLQAWGIPMTLSAPVVAVALGISAAASAAPFVTAADNRARQVAARVADLDDLVPIIAGGIVLSVVASGGDRVLRDLAITIAVGTGAGVSGWLLFEQSEGAERGVFVLGTLAMMGGLAGYLGVSPLLAGLAAGFLWAKTPGHTDRVAAADLQKVQHPLVVLLLLTAGASLQPALAGIWLFAPYLLVRVSGKLAGGWLASRLAPEVAPADLGAYLLPPGVLGIALALNLRQVGGEAAAPLLFAIATGAVAAEFVTLLVTPVPGERA